MGCALSKQLLHGKINPEQEPSTGKYPDVENCQEEAQTTLSVSNKVDNQQEEAHKQKPPSEALHAWQPSESEDDIQEPNNINEQLQQSRTQSQTWQPTEEANPNQAEHLYEQVLPNQPHAKETSELEDEKKPVYLIEQPTVCESCTRPETELEKQHEHAREKRPPSQPNVWLHSELNQPGHINKQRPTSQPNSWPWSEVENEYKPGKINKQSAPSQSDTCAWHKSELEQENQLGKRREQSPTFRLNTWQHSELENENQSGQKTEQESPSQHDTRTWQKSELEEGSQLGQRHEQMLTSQPNSFQQSEVEKENHPGHMHHQRLPSQPNKCIWPNSELEEKNKPGKLHDEQSPPSGTNTWQESELNHESQPGQMFEKRPPSQPHICQPSELAKQQQQQQQQQQPEQIYNQLSLSHPHSSLLDNQSTQDQMHQEGSLTQAPGEWPWSELDKTKLLNKTDLLSQKGLPLESVTVESPLGVQLPKDWIPMPNPDMTFHKVTLHGDSDEFKEVIKHLQPDNDKFRVQKIERIQNPQLYRCYMQRKKEMDEVNGGSNEMRLFHGADNTSMLAIVENGFSRNSCSVQKKAYGRGLYFCKDAFYSTGYTGSNGGNDDRYLYLARVLVGEYCQGNSLMILPPPKQPSIPETLYESVVDNTADPSIFVVFYSAQCYPEYLITI